MRGDIGSWVDLPEVKSRIAVHNLLQFVASRLTLSYESTALSSSSMGPEYLSEKFRMVKLQMRRLSERPRMLVLMLAVMLPAAALIVASVYHLRSIQREKAVEAVIQRDYQQVLAIAEKRIAERAYEVTQSAKAKFPDVDHPRDLDEFLETSSRYRARFSLERRRRSRISVSAGPYERS